MRRVTAAAFALRATASKALLLTTVALACAQAVDENHTLTAIDGISVQANVSVALNAPVSTRSVTATNSNGCAFTLPASFSVLDARPTIAGVTPAVLHPGETNVPLTITGTNFNINSIMSAGSGIALTSTGHKITGILWDDIHFHETPYDKWVAYGQAKTADALFAVHLDQVRDGRASTAPYTA